MYFLYLRPRFVAVSVFLGPGSELETMGGWENLVRGRSRPIVCRTSTSTWREECVDCEKLFRFAGVPLLVHGSVVTGYRLIVLRPGRIGIIVLRPNHENSILSKAAGAVPRKISKGRRTFSPETDVSPAPPPHPPPLYKSLLILHLPPNSSPEH